MYRDTPIQDDSLPSRFAYQQLWLGCNPKYPPEYYLTHTIKQMEIEYLMLKCIKPKELLFD